MKKNIIYCLILMTAIVTLVGCNSDKKAGAGDAQINDAISSELGGDVIVAMNDLYATQINYSNGTAPLNIIPTTTVEIIYDNWDAIEASDIAEAPISLREYVNPSIVYLDYESGYSVKWNKDENDVTVEETNIQDREDYKQKQHK